MKVAPDSGLEAGGEMQPQKGAGHASMRKHKHCPHTGSAEENLKKGSTMSHRKTMHTSTTSIQISCVMGSAL